MILVSASSVNANLAPSDHLNISISPCTGDDTTWAIVQRWLNSCTETHGRCKQKYSAAFVPTRLLQLESSGIEPSFRLVHAPEVAPSTPYVTMSHCFEDDVDDDSLRLTKSNLTQLSSPRPVSALPLAFREVLTVVSRLGLTHLWVDRLCVIQDSSSDQVAEAIKMRDVFSNSFVSITALGSTNPSSGLFSMRDPTLVAPTVFDFPVDGEGTVIPHRHELEVPRAYRRFFGDDPLATSASVLQERLLAPRVLHFGSKMVFWECHEATCAEIHPLGVEEAMKSLCFMPMWFEPEEEETNKNQEIHRHKKPWKTLLNGPDGWLQDDPADQVFDNWFAMVALYSTCSLKTPEQKLPGMAGLAGDMKRLLQNCGCEDIGYLAGMWKMMLPGGLMWTMREPGRRPVTYRSPSWSWAAVDGGRLSFQHNTPDNARKGLFCKLVSASVTSCTADETGEVTAGSIVLKGKLALGKLYSTQDPCTQHLLGNELLVKSFADANDASTVAEPVADPHSGYNYHWSTRFDTKEDMRDEVMCLPICGEMHPHYGYGISGLALSQTNNGCYIRLGTWSILVKTEEEGLAIFKNLSDREMTIV